VAASLLVTDDELVGEVLGIFYRDDESGFGVIELAPEPGGAASHPDREDDEGARCSGPLSDLVEGQTVKLVGRWKDHPRYGLTFEATYYEQVAPTTVAGVRSFLASERFAEVPQRVRDRVVTTFGEGTGRVIEHEPARLVSEAGITAAQAESLHEAWVAGQALGELVRLVEPVRWPLDAVRAVHTRFSGDAARVARDDPYALLAADRVRFAQVDDLARHLGIAPTDPRRLTAGARAAVTAARRQDGHQHLPLPACTEAASALLKVDAVLARAGIDAAVAEGALAVEQVDGEPVVAPPEAFRVEADLAAGLVRLLTAERPRLVPHAAAVSPSNELTGGRPTPSGWRSRPRCPCSPVVPGPARPAPCRRSSPRPRRPTSRWRSVPPPGVRPSVSRSSSAAPRPRSTVCSRRGRQGRAREGVGASSSATAASSSSRTTCWSWTRCRCATRGWRSGSSRPWTTGRTCCWSATPTSCRRSDRGTCCATSSAAASSRPRPSPRCTGRRQGAGSSGSPGSSWPARSATSPGSMPTSSSPRSLAATPSRSGWCGRSPSGRPTTSGSTSTTCRCSRRSTVARPASTRSTTRSRPD
jgi:hypothetical protein